MDTALRQTSKHILIYQQDAMSNKLKTLSATELEHFIKEKVDDYLDEDCICSVTNLDTPNIDTDADIGATDQRNLRFEVEISYEES
jgi:hypothetical protein